MLTLLMFGQVTGKGRYISPMTVNLCRTQAKAAVLPTAKAPVCTACEHCLLFADRQLWQQSKQLLTGVGSSQGPALCFRCYCAPASPAAVFWQGGLFLGRGQGAL